MPIGEICNREVVIVRRDETVVECAQLMRRHHVGDLVVVDEANGRRVPVGIVTDRDIVIEVIAKEVNPALLTAGEIMASELICVRESDGIFEAIRLMCEKAVRRLPVIDSQGTLVGIVTADDLVDIFAEEMNGLSKVISRQRDQEARRRQ